MATKIYSTASKIVGKRRRRINYQSQIDAMVRRDAVAKEKVDTLALAVLNYIKGDRSKSLELLMEYADRIKDVCAKTTQVDRLEVLRTEIVEQAMAKCFA